MTELLDRRISWSGRRPRKASSSKGKAAASLSGKGQTSVPPRALFYTREGPSVPWLRWRVLYAAPLEMDRLLAFVCSRRGNSARVDPPNFPYPARSAPDKIALACCRVSPPRDQVRTKLARTRTAYRR